MLDLNQFTFTKNLKSSLLSLGCQFYPIGEYLKFVRVPENLEIGTEILSFEAHPRDRLVITSVDKVHIAILLCVLTFLLHLQGVPELGRQR